MVMEHISTLLSDPVAVLQSMTQLKGEGHQSQLDEDISQLRREIKNLTSQEQRYLKAYALGEVDNDWIKAQSGPVKTHRGGAEKVLEKLESQRSFSHPLEDMRESLEEVWQRVKGRSASLGFDEKRLDFEALNVFATLSDGHIEENAALGVYDQD
jgi:hypothetical protein